jgi:hypothetical protein
MKTAASGNPFLAGLLSELSKEAIDPASMLLGAAVIPLLRRLAVMGSAAKATKIVQALESKGLPTASLPFSVRHPHLSAMFAPGTLEKRVTEVETSAREYADRSMSRSMSREIHEALKEGLLSEIEKEALIIPKAGLAKAKLDVLKSRAVPSSGNVRPMDARHDLGMTKRPSIAAGGLPDAPAGRFMMPRGGAPPAARPAARAAAPSFMSRPLADAPTGRFMAVKR